MKIFVTLLQGLWSTCQLFCSSAKTFFIAHIFFKEAVALFHKIGKSDCFRKWFLRLLHSLQSSSQLFCWGFFFRPYCFQKAVVLSHRLEKSECFGEYFLRAVVQSLKEFSAFLLRPFFEKSGWPKLKWTHQYWLGRFGQWFIPNFRTNRISKLAAILVIVCWSTEYVYCSGWPKHTSCRSE